LTTKTFKLRADQIQRLVPEMGYCMASDYITVEGKPVGFMYRDPPDREDDSGWRFFAGTEPDDDDPSRYAMYSVNTIANYDPGIVPFLDAPPRSAFGRDPQSGAFVEEQYRGEE
jgi:hypothetical protein